MKLVVLKIGICWCEFPYSLTLVHFAENEEKNVHDLCIEFRGKLDLRNEMKTYRNCHLVQRNELA